jgi:hypothetical protein
LDEGGDWLVSGVCIRREGKGKGGLASRLQWFRSSPFFARHSGAGGTTNCHQRSLLLLLVVLLLATAV